MNLKKLFVCLCVAMLSLGAQAQNWRNAPKVILGLRGGLSAANVSGTDGATDDLWSFTGGLSASFRIAVLPFYVETGLYYENMGCKELGDSWNDHSAVIPAVLSYHIYVDENMAIQPYFGPSLIYSGDASQLCGGLRLGCGFNYKKFYVGMGMDFNLTKDYGDYDDWNEHDYNYYDNTNWAGFLTVGVNI